MIMGRLSELRRSLYGPEGSKGLTTERSGVDGPDVAGGEVTVAPIYLPRNGPLAHIPLVKEAEDEPKAASTTPTNPRAETEKTASCFSLMPPHASTRRPLPRAESGGSQHLRGVAHGR
jgi:hypothetical protein